MSSITTVALEGDWYVLDRMVEPQESLLTEEAGD